MQADEAAFIDRLTVNVTAIITIDRTTEAPSTQDALLVVGTKRLVVSNCKGNRKDGMLLLATELHLNSTKGSVIMVVKPNFRVLEL